MEKYVEVAKTLYPLADDDREDGREFPWCVSDYQPIIDHFGTVAVQVTDDDYQGDSRILYADTGKGFGYLNFGWGSCSGCDARQGCSSYRELAELISGLDSSIRWASREDLLKFFKEHDWEGEYSWHEDGQKQFIEQAIARLEVPNAR